MGTPTRGTIIWPREVCEVIDPMREVTPSAEVVRFGVFEVDLRTGELRRQGRKVRLQEHSFQILALLLARPGGLVTREELRKKLWPGDTFVDFEHGLGTAVSRLREALGDSADNPRFIETLARRGYRFIAPVDGVLAPASTPALQRRGLWLAMGAGLGALALIALAYLFTRPLPPPRILRTTQLTNDGKPKGGRILTDGPRVYFTEFVGTRYVVARFPRRVGRRH